MDFSSSGQNKNHYLFYFDYIEIHNVLNGLNRMKPVV